jgi:hypothetical protein
MEWTNTHGLPDPLASAIKNDPYAAAGDISVTGLLRPPRMRVLEKTYQGQITEDVADHIWRLLGQSVHTILERANTDHHLAEERLVVEVLGWKISGKPDLLSEDGTLSDYKVTSVFSFLLGEKPEWEAQLNIYAWMYRRYGFAVKKAQIVAILRDWTSSRQKESDYPPCGVLVVDVPLWEDAQVEMFVQERVLLHQQAEKRGLQDLAECTPEERWARPDTWAVKKPGAKRATRVFDNPAAAQALAQENGQEIEHRPGGNIRCERFCVVARWCGQYQKIQKEAA